MPILTCIFFTFNWLTLTSEMHFVKFHPEIASCLLSRGKRKYAPLGMRLLWKYIRNYYLIYHLTSHFLLYLQNYKEFEAEILDLQSEKYGLSFDVKKYTTSGWALGDENVIGIRAFKTRDIVLEYISFWFIFYYVATRPKSHYILNLIILHNIQFEIFKIKLETLDQPTSGHFFGLMLIWNRIKPRSMLGWHCVILISQFIGQSLILSFFFYQDYCFIYMQANMDVRPFCNVI